MSLFVKVEERVFAIYNKNRSFESYKSSNPIDFLPLEGSVDISTSLAACSISISQVDHKLVERVQNQAVPLVDSCMIKLKRAFGDSLEWISGRFVGMIEQGVCLVEMQGIENKYYYSFLSGESFDEAIIGAPIYLISDSTFIGVYAGCGRLITSQRIYELICANISESTPINSLPFTSPHSPRISTFDISLYKNEQRNTLMALRELKTSLDTTPIILRKPVQIKLDERGLTIRCVQLLRNPNLCFYASELLISIITHNRLLASRIVATGVSSAILEALETSYENKSINNTQSLIDLAALLIEEDKDIESHKNFTRLYLRMIEDDNVHAESVILSLGKIVRRPDLIIHLSSTDIARLISVHSMIVNAALKDVYNVRVLHPIIKNIGID